MWGVSSINFNLGFSNFIGNISLIFYYVASPLITLKKRNIFDFPDQHVIKHPEHGILCTFRSLICCL